MSQRYTVVDNTEKDQATVHIRDQGYLLRQPDVFLQVFCGREYSVLSLSVQSARDLADALNNCANEMAMRKS